MQRRSHKKLGHDRGKLRPRGSKPRFPAAKLRFVVVGFVVAAAVVGGLCWAFGSGQGALDLAGSPNRTDRLKAIDQLRQRTDSAARTALVRLTADEDWRVAATAAWALGESRDAGCADTLLEIVHDQGRDRRVRAKAAGAIGRLKGVDPNALTEILLGDADAGVRAGAAKGLIHLRDPKTVASLVRALDDRDAEVRRWAMAAIHSMTVRRFPFDPQAPSERRREVVEQIKAYLREAGVL